MVHITIEDVIINTDTGADTGTETGTNNNTERAETQFYVESSVGRAFGKDNAHLSCYSLLWSAECADGFDCGENGVLDRSSAICSCSCLPGYERNGGECSSMLS